MPTADAISAHFLKNAAFLIFTFLLQVVAYQIGKTNSFTVDSSNTDLNSAWMGMGLRSLFDESTIVLNMKTNIIQKDHNL